MTDLSDISSKELLFDRQECYNDVAICLVAIVQDVQHRLTNEVVMRLNKNLKMLEIIRLECEERGFDPAQYDHVKGARLR